MRGIAIGVGCRKGCSADAIEGLILQALDRAPSAPALGIFTILDKRGEEGLAEAATRLGLQLVFLDRDALREREGEVQTRSPLAESLFGVPSVSEAAALAGAGPGSILVVPRIAEGGATCAVAEAAP